MATRWLARLPSPLAIFALALGGVLVGITVTKGVQDPDYFWHISAGKLIAQTGSVPSTDPFSFTWSGQPWTPHEWLSELLMYWLVTGLGATARLFVWGFFPAAIAWVQAAMLSRQGGGNRRRSRRRPSHRAGRHPVRHTPAPGGLLAAPHRPGLGPARAAARAPAPRSLALLPFFVLWANLHGV